MSGELRPKKFSNGMSRQLLDSFLPLAQVAIELGENMLIWSQQADLLRNVMGC
jgi:hypothetical protein